MYKMRATPEVLTFILTNVKYHEEFCKVYQSFAKLDVPPMLRIPSMEDGSWGDEQEEALFEFVLGVSKCVVNAVEENFKNTKDWHGPPFPDIVEIDVTDAAFEALGIVFSDIVAMTAELEDNEESPLPEKFARIFHEDYLPQVKEASQAFEKVE